MAVAKRKKSNSAARTRYKNESFLKALGEHCRKLRLQKGYSIDRLSKEADQLSPASIDRLERGVADSHVLVLERFADTLGLTPLDLFSFLKERPNISKDSRIIPYEENLRPSSTYVPVYSIQVAAGKFSNDSNYANESPLGWIDANLKTQSNNDYFAVFVNGQSMQPKIMDGDLCLFRKYSGGSRQGKIFLLQTRSLRDAESGESFVVKKYMRQTPPRRAHDEDSVAPVIHLISENPRYSAIVLYGLSDDEVQTIAEFVKVI